MKSAYLIVLAACVWLSSQTVKAGNLLTDKYIVEEGTVTLGPDYAVFGTSEGVIQQTFPTVAGTNYVLEYEYKTTGSAAAYLDTRVSGSTNTLVSASSETTSTNYTIQAYAFAASGTSATIDFYGDQSTLYLVNTTVSAGSFTQPGAYSGNVTVAKALTAEGISSSHVETLVSKITPSGGMYTISQPSGDVIIGGFLNDSTFVYDGKTAPAKLNGNSLTFTLTESGTATDGFESTPETETEAVSLTY
jgi:hypothetical protein